MTDAQCPYDGVSLDFFSQIDQTACFFADSDGAVVVDGDTGRVITTIFQLGQSIHQKSAASLSPM